MMIIVLLQNVIVVLHSVEIEVLGVRPRQKAGQLHAISPAPTREIFQKIIALSATK